MKEYTLGMGKKFFSGLKKGDMIRHIPTGVVAPLVAVHDFRGSDTVEVKIKGCDERVMWHDGWNCEPAANQSAIVDAAAWVNELQEIVSWLESRFQIGTRIESENTTAYREAERLLWEARYTCLWGALKDAGMLDDIN